MYEKKNHHPPNNLNDIINEDYLDEIAPSFYIYYILSDEDKIQLWKYKLKENYYLLASIDPGGLLIEYSTYSDEDCTQKISSSDNFYIPKYKTDLDGMIAGLGMASSHDEMIAYVGIPDKMEKYPQSKWELVIWLNDDNRKLIYWPNKEYKKVYLNKNRYKIIDDFVLELY